MTEDNDGLWHTEPKERELYILSEFFKILGNSTRIRILLLLIEQDACVNALAKQLEITQSAVSHQLRLLKSNKLVRQRRYGKTILYTLIDEHVRVAIEKGLEYILE